MFRKQFEIVRVTLFDTIALNYVDFLLRLMASEKCFILFFPNSFSTSRKSHIRCYLENKWFVLNLKAVVNPCLKLHFFPTIIFLPIYPQKFIPLSLLQKISFSQRTSFLFFSPFQRCIYWNFFTFFVFNLFIE